MNINKGLLSIGAVACTCVSFYIGAGYATMQEIIQYEVSYGSLFPVVILVAGTIYLYTNVSFATNGHRLHLRHGTDIYDVYCSVMGKRVGHLVSLFFKYFSILFCLMGFVVITGGITSVMVEQWQWPRYAGAIFFMTVTVLTVVLRLRGILKVLSFSGPLLILGVLAIDLHGVYTGWFSIPHNMAEIDSGVFQGVIKQVGDGNPIYSGISYGGFVILWFAAFIAELGITKRLHHVNKGMFVSAICVFGVAMLGCLALIGHIHKTANVDVPALFLAKSIAPWFAAGFSLIIIIGGYTSAVPLLWTVASSVAHEKTMTYKLLTIGMGVLATLFAYFVPYKSLLNVLYGLNGYVGSFLVIMMIIYDIKTCMSKHNHKHHNFPKRMATSQ